MPSFFQSTIVGCWNFQFEDIIKNAVMKSSANLLTHITCVFLLKMYVRAKYLIQEIYVYSFFVDNAKSLSKVDAPIHSSTAGLKSRCYSKHFSIAAFKF